LRLVVRRGGGGSPRESGKDWLATAGENTVADCGWLHEEELSTLHACVCLYGKKITRGPGSLLPSSPMGFRPK
jgi:hypothetical protein